MAQPELEALVKDYWYVSLIWRRRSFYSTGSITFKEAVRKLDWILSDRALTPTLMEVGEKLREEIVLGERKRRA